MNESTLQIQQDAASEEIWSLLEEDLSYITQKLTQAAKQLDRRMMRIDEVEGELTSYQQRLIDSGGIPIQQILETMGKILASYDLEKISACNRRHDSLNIVDNELEQFLLALKE